MVRRLALSCTCLIAIGLILPTQSFAEIDPATVAGAWLFDEEEAEVVEDVSGNENNGVVKSIPKWDKGKFGNAIVLDGIDDYVNCGAQESLSVGLDDFSIVAWMRASKNTPASWAGCVIARFDANVPRHGYLFGIRGALDATQKDNPLFLMGLGQASGAHLFGTSSITDDQWHHIAATADRDGDAIFYRDGVFESRMNIAAFIAEDESNAQDLNIGADFNSRWFLNAIIDEVAFFKTLLTEDDIKEIMNDGLGRALGLTAV
ncbi:LamG domain-containing protein, partial [Candidatus Poribacteria bacterium]